MKRREFLLLTTGAGALSSLAQAATAVSSREIDAGPASTYNAEGVYPAFRDQGFFVIRKEGKTFALSSLCTHRKCKLKPERDQSFSCPCHGSTFAVSGKVLSGPASKDLPILPSTVNGKGRLIVKAP